MWMRYGCRGKYINHIRLCRECEHRNDVFGCIEYRRRQNMHWMFD